MYVILKYITGNISLTELPTTPVILQFSLEHLFVLEIDKIKTFRQIILKICVLKMCETLILFSFLLKFNI